MEYKTTQKITIESFWGYQLKDSVDPTREFVNFLNEQGLISFQITAPIKSRDNKRLVHGRVDMMISFEDYCDTEEEFLASLAQAMQTEKPFAVKKIDGRFRMPGASFRKWE